MRVSGRFPWALGLVLGAMPGCAKDVILPVDSVCGDLKKEGTEECDLLSDGCVECKVAKGYTCNDTDCTAVCGDSLVRGDEECDPPDGVTCDSSCRSGQKAEDCDMTGYWISRETDFSIDSVLSQVQTSSNYYAYRIEQTGDTFEVAEMLSCGIIVSGSASVNLTTGGIRGLMYLNPQDRTATAGHGPRRGTFVKSGNGCAFNMDRHYIVRGLEDRFLPTDFTAKPDLATLTPLPSEDNPEHTPGKPFGQNTAGAVDTDGDGFLGIKFVISGNASGSRNAVQRDWAEYFPDPANPIPLQAIELVASARFANQENILYVSGCPLLGCGILLAGSVPSPNLDHRVRLRYLGKDPTDPRVSQIFVAKMKQDPDQDMITCTNVRAALPHDPTDH